MILLIIYELDICSFIAYQAFYDGEKNHYRMAQFTFLTIIRTLVRCDDAWFVTDSYFYCGIS